MNCFNFIYDFDHKINLNQLMTNFKIFLNDHTQCDKHLFDIMQCDDLFHFYCKKCMFN